MQIVAKDMVIEELQEDDDDMGLLHPCIVAAVEVLDLVVFNYILHFTI